MTLTPKQAAELLSQNRRVGRPQINTDPEAARARKRAQSGAASAARVTLSYMYPEDYEVLYEVELTARLKAIGQKP